jgi:hypothetical protein
MKKILVTVLMISNFSTAYSVENQMASAQATNTSCTQESETAKCGNDKVGTGLLECFNTYKKTHKDFKITDVCEASLKQFRRDVKAKKD